MTDMELKLARNTRVAARWDELSAVGKHGHYETLFQVVREEVEAAHEQCAAVAENVAASRHPENSIDWNDGFGQGADAAADRIREITNPQQPTAA